MAGKTLGTVTTAMIKGVVFLIVLVAAGLVKFDPRLGMLIAFGFMFLISTAFVSLGIAVAAKMTDPHGFQSIMNFLTMPVFSYRELYFLWTESLSGSWW